MKHIITFAVLICLAVGAHAQSGGTEGTAPGAVTPVYTTTGFPHFINLDWNPAGGDPFALTGTMVVSSAGPGASGVLLASLAGTDQLAFGFLPLLVDTHPMNLSQFAYFGFDAGGGLTVPNVTRQIPALAGMQMHVQVFEYSPILTSSNALVFDISL